MPLPIVIGALGTVSNRFHLYLNKVRLDGSMQPLQRAFRSLGTARKLIIIRKLMDGNDQVGRPRKLCKMAIIIIKISMNKNLLLAGKIGSCHLDQLIFIAI